MTKKFCIFGDIVDETSMLNDSDVCLHDFKSFIDTLSDGDKDITIEICSCGGDVFQGIAIANLIKQERANGRRFTAHVVSIAASIASVIASACDEIAMDDNSLFMCHLPWTTVQGNAIDLAKEINQLEQCKKALISFYRSKFDLTDEEIEKMLIEETWIDADSVGTYKMKCTIIPTESDTRYAAKLVEKIKSKFHNSLIIERLKEMQDKVNNEEVTSSPEEEKKEEQQKEVAEEVKQEVKEEAQTNEQEEQKPTYEELEKKVEELTQKLDECMKQLDECKPDEDVEKRVSGMQSKMQNKINDLSKDFNNKLEIANKELQSFKDECISLKDKLDKASRELSEMTSAFEEKNKALAELNARVNTPNETDPNAWRKLKGKQFFDWLEANKDKINKTK